MIVKLTGTMNSDIVIQAFLNIFACTQIVSVSNHDVIAKSAIVPKKILL